MKNTIALICVFISSALIGQNNLDVSYLSSGGKLKPLQAIMDIRHYDINLMWILQKEPFKEIPLLL